MSFVKLITCLFMCFTSILAAKPIEKPSKEIEKLPELQVDSVTKQLKTFDYGINIKPIEPKSASLLPFKGKNLFIFFFSVNCSHCKKAAPHIEKLAKELSPDSLNFVAVATEHSPVKKIPEFRKNTGLTLPVFYDHLRAFSNAYGAGTVPIFTLINKKGNYFQLISFSGEFTPPLLKKLYSDQKHFQGR